MNDHDIMQCACGLRGSFKQVSPSVLHGGSFEWTRWHIFAKQSPANHQCTTRWDRSQDKSVTVCHK